MFSRMKTIKMLKMMFQKTTTGAMIQQMTTSHMGTDMEMTAMMARTDMVRIRDFMMSFLLTTTVVTATVVDSTTTVVIMAG